MGRCRAEGVAGNPLASHLRLLSMPSLCDLTLTMAFFSSPLLPSPALIHQLTRWTCLATGPSPPCPLLLFPPSSLFASLFSSLHPFSQRPCRGGVPLGTMRR